MTLLLNFLIGVATALLAIFGAPFLFRLCIAMIEAMGTRLFNGIPCSTSARPSGAYYRADPIDSELFDHTCLHWCVCGTCLFPPGSDWPRKLPDDDHHIWQAEHVVAGFGEDAAPTSFGSSWTSEH